jgi:2-aminoadipate transaminase
MINYKELLADRTKIMGVNAIREILKVVAQPGMISLAGGIPAPESFPLFLMQRLMDSVLARYGAAALQYDPSEGFGPLREALAGYLEQVGIDASSREILVTSGSQGALDAVAKVLISKGDRVAVEAPTYLGALQAFAPYEPRYAQVAADDGGMIPDALEQVLRQGQVKLVYLVPTFQNPTGRTLSLRRRQAVARLLQQYDTLLVEDDPYSALRYQGEALPPIKTLAPEHVVYISTLSKVFAPGLRIGLCMAPGPIRKWMVVAKQGIDLHTSTLNQALAAEYLSGGHLQEHLPDIIDLYAPRQHAMLAALDRYFPSGFSWSRPRGGMFIWVQGPPGHNMVECYHRAVGRKVAFVPGTFFYAGSGQGMETMRLNFTMANEKTLSKAIKIVAEVLQADPVGTSGACAKGGVGLN